MVAARGLDKGTRHGSGGCETERRPAGFYPEVAIRASLMA